MLAIPLEAAKTPVVVKDAPHDTPVSHPDDTEAALHPITSWQDLCAVQK